MESSLVCELHLRWLTNLVVQRMCSLLPMVLSNLVILLVQTRNLLPRTLPKNETSCIILRTLGPFDSVLVNLFLKDVVAQSVGDGLRRHRRRVEVEKRGIVGFLVKQLERKC